tara:strand:+ start:656 stop:1042 length:387 start_codon:yes stop_codon:yes gene_type:complete
VEILKSNIDDSSVTVINLGDKIDSSTNRVYGEIDLDIETQVKFVDYVNSIIEEDISKIVINLENVSYIDSSGLWAIFESFKKADQRNIELILATPQKDVKRVLDITKISTKINVFKDKKNALNYFTNK